MARKPQVSKVPPRSLKLGQQVWSKDFKRVEEVKNISVVVHLDNGHDEVYREGESVELVREKP